MYGLFKYLAENWGASKVWAINLPEFTMKLKDAMSNPAIRAEDIKHPVLTSKFLFVDEAGSEDITKYESEVFYEIVSIRDSKRLLTCYTSNYDIETLEKIAQYHHLRAAINRIRGHAVQLIVNAGCLRK